MIHRAKILITSLVLLIASDLCFASPSAATQNTNSDYVVLLHGLIRTSSAMKRLEWAFEEQGYRVINITYPCTKLSIEDIASQTLAEILKERIQDRNVKVHFVTHSLGGIVLREYLSNNPMTNLGRVVMIAPPNHGSELVDNFRSWPFFEFFTGPAGQQLGTDPESVPKRLGPAKFDLGVIAGDRTLNPFYSMFLPGPDDGKVSVASTKLEGMDDFLIVHYSHTYLPWRKQVIKACVHFIEEGQFGPIPEFTPAQPQPASKEMQASLSQFDSPKAQSLR
jgi:pimeloyl-ACP methyl ester carboxylesterase